MIAFLMWRSHYYMTYNDPAFINDCKDIVEASELPEEKFNELLDKTIAKITGLTKDSD